MKKKYMSSFIATVLLGAGAFFADIFFNDGLFFNKAISSSIFNVKNIEDQYMSINLDRTRYLESIVITNAYYLQKGAEEYASYNNRHYPATYAELYIPDMINPFDLFWYCVVDNIHPSQGQVGYYHLIYSSNTYMIVGAGKDGRIITTLNSSYTDN